jgi:hypothetical protein
MRCWSPQVVGSSHGLHGDAIRRAVLYLGISKPRDAAGAASRRGEKDPHLRSIEAVTGYHIHAIDGEIDRVEDQS